MIEGLEARRNPLAGIACHTSSAGTLRACIAKRAERFSSGKCRDNVAGRVIVRSSARKMNVARPADGGVVFVCLGGYLADGEREAVDHD